MNYGDSHILLIARLNIGVNKSKVLLLEYVLGSETATQPGRLPQCVKATARLKDYLLNKPHHVHYLGGRPPTKPPARRQIPRSRSA